MVHWQVHSRIYCSLPSSFTRLPQRYLPPGPQPATTTLLGWVWCKSKLSPIWYNLLRSNSLHHSQRRLNLTASLLHPLLLLPVLLLIHMHWVTSKRSSHPPPLLLLAGWPKAIIKGKRRGGEGGRWLVRTNLSMNQRTNGANEKLANIYRSCRLRATFHKSPTTCSSQSPLLASSTGPADTIRFDGEMPVPVSEQVPHRTEEMSFYDTFTPLQRERETLRSSDLSNKIDELRQNPIYRREQQTLEWVAARSAVPWK